MKAVRPITMGLSITDTLLIIEGLNHIIKDKERHELDKELSERLKDRIIETVKENSIEIERGD